MHVIGKHRRADDENDVVTGQAIGQRLAQRRQEPGEQRMVLGKAAAAGHRAFPDRGVEAFRELNRERPGAVLVYGSAHHKSRMPAGIERVRQTIECAGVRGKLNVGLTRFHRIGLHIPIILGDGDEHRAARPLQRPYRSPAR